MRPLLLKMYIAPLLAPARPLFPSFAHAPTPAARSGCPAPRARATLPRATQPCAARPCALAPPILAPPGHARPQRPATQEGETAAVAGWSVRGVVRRRNERIRFRVWRHVYISFISWVVGQGGLAGFGAQVLIISVFRLFRFGSP